MSRTERRLAQARVEIEALRKDMQQLHAALDALTNENMRLRSALQSQAASWQVVAADVAREVGGVLAFAEPHIKRHLAMMATLRLDEIQNALLALDADTRGSL
jgi:regulator of replication initiation timing